MIDEEKTAIIGNEEELVRIKIMRGGVPSSISMDLYLASLLQEKLGGSAELKLWVQNTVDDLERIWGEKAMQSKAGERVRIKSGLSRLIQREAIRTILSLANGV